MELLVKYNRSEFRFQLDVDVISIKNAIFEVTIIMSSCDLICEKEVYYQYHQEL